MGHSVTGLVGAQELLERFAERRALHPPVSLIEGLAILPLRDRDLDAFLLPPMTGHPEGFTYLSEQLAKELRLASVGGMLMYFETEYFGGSGVQGAAVFCDGATVFGPKAAEFGPINEALARLGVRVSSPGRDEFDTVGLDRHRHTEDWLGEGRGDDD